MRSAVEADTGCVSVVSGPEQRWGAVAGDLGWAAPGYVCVLLLRPVGVWVGKKASEKSEKKESGFVSCVFLSHGSCKFADSEARGYLCTVSKLCVPNRLHWAAASFKYGSSSLIRSEQGQRT